MFDIKTCSGCIGKQTSPSHLYLGTWVKVVNSGNTEGQGPGAGEAPDGGKGGNGPFSTEQF